ncbi:MAG: hypothetical protein ACTJGL_14810, partial [Vreelandella alkaliphila]
FHNTFSLKKVSTFSGAFQPLTPHSSLLTPHSSLLTHESVRKTTHQLTYGVRNPRHLTLF